MQLSAGTCDVGGMAAEPALRALKSAVRDGLQFSCDVTDGRISCISSYIGDLCCGLLRGCSASVAEHHQCAALQFCGAWPGSNTTVTGPAAYLYVRTSDMKADLSTMMSDIHDLLQQCFSADVYVGLRLECQALSGHNQASCMLCGGDIIAYHVWLHSSAMMPQAMRC